MKSINLSIITLLSLVTSLFFLASCTPATPTSCDIDSDCQAVFNRCSCSWVCLNEGAELDYTYIDPDTGETTLCEERTCPGDINPGQIPEKPDCGCVSISESGSVPEASQVTRQCRIS